MNRGSLHQFLTGATAGDAITGQALIIRRWLRELGFRSNIYAQYIHKSMEAEVIQLQLFRTEKKIDWAIYHHSIGSDLPAYLASAKLQILLIYHNVTPTEFFSRSDPQRAELARLGKQQLYELQPLTRLALADSTFNKLDLVKADFRKVGVLPITLRAEDYELPENNSIARDLRGQGPNLLFVGRLAPNKKQEDLVKLLYHCRRLDADTRLFLVGDRWEIGYDKWVERLAVEFDIQKGVILTGKISQQDMVSYYRNATLYVSMSEHEGFGLPLIESMYCGLPVMAYGVSAIPGTMGKAGILFFEKDYVRLAELVHLLAYDQNLRQRIISRQRQHMQKYLEPKVRQQLQGYLQDIGLLDPLAEEIKS